MNIFNFVKSQVRLIDVVEQYTRLKRAGSYYKAVCPFHSERTASFTVSPDKNIFYCFGCQAGGDVISFLAKIENCGQLEAARDLAERYQLELPREVSLSTSHDQAVTKRSYHRLCALVAAWCQDRLRASSKAKKYVHQRGITQASMERFGIGYFPDGASALTRLIEYVKQHNFLVDDLLQAKIIMEGASGLYSPFQERIIFPIYDHLSRCCGFGGRVFMPHDERAKYYNSHEHDFFSKGSLLFGFDKAKKAIAQQDAVILVEGYTDCIALVQHGWPYTVATLGTACSREHLKHLARYAQKLYIMFDGDQAGQKAIYRLTELCWEVDLDLYVVSLPTGTDPASFLAAGHTLDDRLADGEDIFIFFINSLGDQFREKGLQERLELARRFIQTTSRLNDSLKQDLLIHKAAQAFEIPPQSLRREIDKEMTVRHETQELQTTERPAVPILAGLTLLEKKLFSAILNNVSSLDQEDEVYLKRYLPRPLQDVLLKILAVGDKKHLSFERVYEILDEDEKQWVSGLVLEWPGEDVDMLRTLIQQFAKRQWKTIVNNVTTQLKYAQQTKDATQIAALVKEFQELKAVLLSRGLI